MCGLPFGRQDEETRGLIDRLNMDIQVHYGHASPTFVRWPLQRKRDWERWVKQYRQSVEAYAERAKVPRRAVWPSTRRQSSSRPHWCTRLWIFHGPTPIH